MQLNKTKAAGELTSSTVSPSGVASITYSGLPTNSSANQFTLSSPDQTILVHQKYKFTLNETLAVVWIDYQHDRFRLDCDEKIVMQFSARYWFCRQFPLATETERVLSAGTFLSFMTKT